MTVSSSHLSLVATDGRSPTPSRGRAALWPAPVRPGEMPARLVLQVAYADGPVVSAGLRAAVAIEAARCLVVASSLRSVESMALADQLDHSAMGSNAPTVTRTSAHRLMDYPHQLRAAGPLVAAPPRAMDVLLPRRQRA